MISVQYVEALEEEGIPMASAEVTMIPQNYVALTDENALKQLQTEHWICWMRMMTYRRYIPIWRNNL